MRIARRTLLAGLGTTVLAQEPITIPIRRITDTRAKVTADAIWPEAERCFASAGMTLQITDIAGEVGRAPSGRPIFKGLAHGTINVVVTDLVPLQWDQARSLSGLTTQYDGYHLCLIAMQHAHGNQAPFFSTNTVVHELLHVLLGDIFETRPKGAAGASREWRIDWLATRLWLLGDGAEIRRQATAYLQHNH